MSEHGIQEALLRVMEACGQWNAFDGPAFAADLRRNRSLWRTAVLMGPTAHVFQDHQTGEVVRVEYDYSPHRGLPEVLYGFDTLQLGVVPGMETQLENLVCKWGADSMRWIGLPDARSALDNDDEAAYAARGGDPRRVILEVWWD